MNINTNSWHYRLVNKVFDMYFVNNLCPYMRRLMGILAVIVFVIPSVLFGMIEAVLFFVYDREYLSWITGDSFFGWYSATFLIFGMVAWLVVFGYLLVTLTLYLGGKVANYLENNQSYQSWQYDRATRARKVKHEPNIFVEWCKARHDQICPKVDFVKEEKTNESQ